MNVDHYMKDLDALIDKGELLYHAIQHGCFPQEFAREAKKSWGDKAEKVIQALPSFGGEYQSWYSEAKALVRQLLPDRLSDFTRYYEKPKSRKAITYENYTIEDHLQGLNFTLGTSKVVGPDAAIPLFYQPLSLVKSMRERFRSSLFDIRQLAQADLFGRRERPGDIALPGEQIKDPFVLEFLDLRDEYSESDLEEALIRHLETFLLELGDDFCFMGRQRRLRVGGRWYRVDLLFFHRRLRCLVVIDLKIGSFTHADAGQMHFYLNYAREHWVREGENPPVGLILCSEKDDALAQYALEGAVEQRDGCRVPDHPARRDGPGSGA